MSSADQPVDPPAPQPDSIPVENEEAAPRRARPYARLPWRALLIVLVLVGMLALLALFPSTYWRF